MARFGNLAIKTRPVKFAFLVDPNNSKQVGEAIQIATSLWGGAYCPIIPMYKRSPSYWKDDHSKFQKASEIINGFIDAYDPDILVQFSQTLPDFFKVESKGIFARYNGLQIIRPDEIWPQSNYHKFIPNFGIGLPEVYGDFFNEFFKYKVKYPVKIVIPNLPNKYSLFWASLFGELSPVLKKSILEAFDESLEIQQKSFQVDEINDFLENKIIFPRRACQYGLTKYNRNIGRSASVFYLDASSMGDIIDYWNLRALGINILPIPKQYQSNSSVLIAIQNLLDNNIKRGSNIKPIILKSRNINNDEFLNFCESIRGDSKSFDIQYWFPRIWDEFYRGSDKVVQDDFYNERKDIEITEYNYNPISFSPVFPKFANTQFSTIHPRCVNEISLRLYGSNEYFSEVLPKLTGRYYQQIISGHTSFRGEWRIGKNGLIHLAKDTFIEKWDVPRAEDVMFAWLKDIGFNPKLSSPGIIAKQIYKILGGRLYLLHNEKLLGLLEHMNGGSVKQDGSPKESNKIGNSRELPVKEVKSRLMNKTRAFSIYDDLVEKKIFKMGIRLKCPHCLRDSWYSLNEIKDEFSCVLCLDTFPAAGNIEKSLWCNKTAGPFSIANYADGAYAVLLSVEFFKENLHGTEITPVLSFVAENMQNKFEADLALFWEDSSRIGDNLAVLFAECKTYGKFQPKDFARMRNLAKLFPGAILTFSTMRKSLENDEIIAISKIAKAGKRRFKNDTQINPVMILTGNEILNHDGPPFCWEDSIAEKFKNINGLIELCNATQQIYLGFES